MMAENDFYKFLLDLAVILLCTKLFGIFSKRVKMPQVVGALVAGILLGPAVLGIIHETEFIRKLSELGVIVLMFTAGMEIKIEDLKNSGKSGLIVAGFGVIVPLILGFVIAGAFNGGFSEMGSKQFLENAFIGVILTATSVSITVETLKEIGKLNTKTGTAILSAALIDDVIGIILLTLITGTTDPSVSLPAVILKIVVFFVLAAVVGIPFYYLFNHFIANKKERRRYVVIAFAFCLILSYIAEEYFGVADITGAFIAGMLLSSAKQVHFINRRFEILSYILISPIFFANIGIGINAIPLDGPILVFSILLLIGAVLGKIIGCGLGGLTSGFKKREALQIGIGMVSRGEVALIVANKGINMGVLSERFFSSIVLIVVITTVITPILLKVVYQSKKPPDSVPELQFEEQAFEP
jgi:Kef-type K+ transport system membrane component KefB